MMAGLFISSRPKTLRPHQTRAIQLLRASLGQGHRRVVLQMATGAGKTLTAAKIIDGALEKGNRVIFTAPAISLIDQTVDAFEAEGIDGIGVMQADHPGTDPAARLQVASVQTLARRDIPPAALVIVDECHIQSEVVARLMDERPDAVFIGLTATPWAKGMGRRWQDLCIAATTRELIDAGHLSPFRVFAAAHPDLDGVRVRGGDYAEGDLAERMGEGALVADVAQTWLELGENRPTLCFAVNRAHARQLHEAFERAGVASAYVDMHTDVVERGLIERRFREGEIRVVCSVRTLTTGVDWPVACIVDAAPTKSEILHVQKIGRGLRINEPWTDCIILDHSDNTLRLGFVTDIHHEALDDGKRKQSSGAGGSEPLPMACPSCAAVLPPRTNPCSQCGHKRKPVAGVEVIDGQLTEVAEGKARKPPTRRDKQRFWGMALWLDAKRDKDRRLAKALFKEKFGHWPDGLSDRPEAPDPDFLNYEHSRRIAYAKSRKKQGRRAA